MATWRTESPHILLPCACQQCDVCWAVALIHQFEANLKLEGKASSGRTPLYSRANQYPAKTSPGVRRFDSW
ncbi:unnamed protein product [Arabidopsis halleri]